MSTALSLTAASQLDPNKVTPGLLGFLVIVAIGLATWALLRSMNRQLRKIDFEEPKPAPKRRRLPDGPGTSASEPSAADDSATRQPPVSRQ